jgi:hypothetical protein
MDWQPIATAPKDGRPILIWDPTQGGPNESAGKTYDNRNYAIGYWRVWQSGGKWMWGNRNSSYYVEPTHWMPLPPPPARV